MTALRALSLIAGTIALVACGRSGGPISPFTITTQLDVSGTVVSAVDDSPIAGAIVRLGVGGHFGIPVVVDSVVADVAGTFTLTPSVPHQPASCGYWVGAGAAGFRTSDPAVDVLLLHCQTAPQNVEIRLDPI